MPFAESAGYRRFGNQSMIDRNPNFLPAKQRKRQTLDLPCPHFPGHGKSGSSYFPSLALNSSYSGVMVAAASFSASCADWSPDMAELIAVCRAFDISLYLPP